MKIFVSTLLLAILSQTTVAADLFGIRLQGSTLDQLRTAVKQAGATVIQEADDSRHYDIFDSETVFPGSSRLYIGHVEAGRHTAFVEYEFVGITRPDLLRLMSAKYGKPAIDDGKYLTDQRYRWQAGGTNIVLWSDWKNYRTRISYQVPEAMRNLADRSVNLTANGQTVDAANY